MTGPTLSVAEVPVQLNLTPTELAALDAYIALQPAPRPSRPEAIRAIIKATFAFSLTV